MEVTYISTAAKKEIDKLPADMRARFVRVVELMEDANTHMIGMPHMRHIEGEIYEIRMKGKAGIARALYVAIEAQELVVLHGFVKKTQATPTKAIQLAKKRWKNRGSNRTAQNEREQKRRTE
ncbi:MAG: hypothetical protein CMM93_08150 [Rickettsiales bacterium]|nr:hypothetical protein [Rickettsiales bacterium]|tara:strand:+ start:1641 stop:2006 length:366 start_codon:yes stop_codon:yes gene_type:complete